MADRPEYESKWTGQQVDDAVGKIIGNGVEPLTTADIVQTTGTSPTKVMSQAAVTSALKNVNPSEKIQEAIQEHNSSEQAHPYIQGLVNAKPNALNDRSDSQSDTYSANYINNSFAPITYVSNLYAQKTGENTAILVDEQPTLSTENILTSANTTNTDYNWTAPDFTLTRTLEVNTTLTATNSFAVNLTFQTSRNATISWGAKLKVSQDDGQTWQYISDNQAYGAIFYETGIGNTAIFNVFANTLQGTETYPIGTMLAIELYKKQSSSTALTTTVYCGVEVDNAGIYTYTQFNFANISIGTNQIEDGSVTLQKLEQSVQNTINSVAGKVDSINSNSSTGYTTKIEKSPETVSISASRGSSVSTIKMDTISIEMSSGNNSLVLDGNGLTLNGEEVGAQPDNQSITKNAENKLQAVGIKHNEELITSEMLYNATHLRVFKDAPTVDPTFENNTWETISQVSSEISQMSETGDDIYTAVKEKYGWSVGDTKTFTIESGENAGTYTAQIWDFNVDTDKDGNKLGIRLGTVELLKTGYHMNDSSTNKGGFGASKIATEILPAVYDTLSSDFKGVIKETKVTYHSGTDNRETELSGNFKLFLMSEFEEYGTTTYALQEGVFLKYWQEHNTEADRIKMKSGGTDAYWCWTRSIDSSHTDSRFGIVLKDGTITSISATFNDGGVCLTFNI